MAITLTLPSPVHQSPAGGQSTAGGLRLELAYNNQQLAARVGSVREVVSRALTRLQHDGLIRLEGRRLTIHDPKALASFAGEEEQ